MSKREKLRQRLRNNPQNASFSDVRKLLEQEGFILDRVTGSHHIFTKNDITFVVPTHNNRVKAIYVKRVLELIERTDNLTDGDERF